jgi:cytoskeletal protein CcmA (bactofilin family)
MALFNREADRNVKDEATPKFAEQQPVEPTLVTQPVSPDGAPGRNPAIVVPSTSAQTGTRAEKRAYLDSGCKIDGKLFFDGATRIDGQVEGEIIAKESLVIGESAVVAARINADSIIIAGRASGDIVARRRLEVRPSAHVTGTLTSPIVIVHEGAMFEGHCSMHPDVSPPRV